MSDEPTASNTATYPIAETSRFQARKDTAGTASFPVLGDVIDRYNKQCIITLTRDAAGRHHVL